ncbi:DUF4450 domain-containing protein [Flavobacterium sp. Sd200]|uniref:DUF4450 domain-containing protein n=1 Tax=Flavobacterium sp. Sd200 TaxID=2692211 RepID=UPI00136E402C|nr:DUF4450 domain-containing protein [Flavobacterium sp. Sd200]MXN92529.1 DUF4450 domain-containing protein [Flavobacterium sp. Sd200]
MHFFKRSFVLSVLLFSLVTTAQELYPVKLADASWHNEERELRYKPDGTDFVITNGSRLFTRALYGTNTAFRVETGDRPEFALYMPGMGGNFKLGFGTNNKTIWATEAQTITARYRPGAMLYTIQDPLLGNGKLLIEVLAMADADGFLIKTELQNVKDPINLFWAFGGASGKNFSRNGDMGPDPESNFYLKPENSKDNIFNITKNSFTLQYGTGLEVNNGGYVIKDSVQQSKTSKEKLLTGTYPTQTQVKTVNSGIVSSPLEFYTSLAGNNPALAGRLNAKNNTPYYFSVHNPATKSALSYKELSKQFALAETARKEIAGRIAINTPDSYINTVGNAIAIASDATWEDPSYLHGSIGWRMRLNGWRGAYTADVLGWHDRAKTHLQSYARSQVIAPESGSVIADTTTHLARSLEKLGVGMFTSGYISRNPDGQKMTAHHYDMNLVFIDIMLRHYDWTGDITFLKETWPLLKRHLDWETRNFDSDGNGLYDAYAAIWASDALQYSGGSVTHTTAYNYFAYTKAAQIAVIMNEDPAPYRNEANKILKAMNAQLWLKDKGVFAEFKDALGNQLLHTAPALWTVYHSMDSETMNPFQSYQSLRYIDNEIPHIPIKAKGLDNGGYYTLSTTKWMPYEWSLNNVALAESMHTALANWQGGRTDEAFKLFKSEVLASMYLGGSPGNFVQISHYDASRKEAYRDFGDPVGMFSRALVEGLFGIAPNALSNSLTIRPGLPSAWNYASFATPDISFDFKRNGQTDVYTIIPKLPQSLDLKFQAIAKGQVKSITINGKSTRWKNIDSAVGLPIIEINADAADKYDIIIAWQGDAPVLPPAEKTYTPGSSIIEQFGNASVLKINDPQGVLTNVNTTPSGFSAKVNTNTITGNYTVFVQLKQGELSWHMPLCFKVEKAISLVNNKNPEANNNSISLQNNTAQDIKATITVNDFSTTATFPAGKTGDEIKVPVNSMVTGTNSIIIKTQDGSVLTEKLYNWDATTTGKLETVNLSKYFNDKVTQIFRNKYLSPRPKTTTLQLPWQGIGDWAHPLKTFNVDDSGLRKLAGANNTFTLPQGVGFSTPGAKDANNILFTSQWDNYPTEKTIPLTGKASHAWFLMAGSTNPMQSQLDNGVIIVEYTDGSKETLALRNPEIWWPIDLDYYTDGFAFALKSPRPIRIHLKTGTIVQGVDSKVNHNGKEIEGGAATVLDLPLDKTKPLKSIILKTIANDVVIGLMAITLQR